jgi:hypothetical protein
MISIPAGARVLLATGPVDFRKGAHGLAALAQEVLLEDPFSGAVIVYRSKRSDRVKILVWDTGGLCRAAPKSVLAGFACTQKCGNGSSLARMISTLTRPYIARFRVLSRLICPSTWPLDHFVVNAFRTAAKSFRSPRAKTRMP